MHVAALKCQFEDQVDRRLRSAPQIGEPSLARHFAQALFTRLRTEAAEVER